MRLLTYPKDAKQLRTKADLVTPEMLVSDEFRINLVEMTEIAKRDGIGLAAPQVGWSAQVIVLMVDRFLVKSPSCPHILINPKIIEESKDLVKASEECLSFPGLSGLNPLRPKSIIFTCQTLDGEKHTMQCAYTPGTESGYYIRVLQHETDHINSILMIDRLSPEETPLVYNWLKTQKF